MQIQTNVSTDLTGSYGTQKSEEASADLFSAIFNSVFENRTVLKSDPVKSDTESYSERMFDSKKDSQAPESVEAAPSKNHNQAESRDLQSNQKKSVSPKNDRISESDHQDKEQALKETSASEPKEVEQDKAEPTSSEKQNVENKAQDADQREIPEASAHHVSEKLKPVVSKENQDVKEAEPVEAEPVEVEPQIEVETEAPAVEVKPENNEEVSLEEEEEPAEEEAAPEEEIPMMEVISTIPLTEADVNINPMELEWDYINPAAAQGETDTNTEVQPSDTQVVKAPLETAQSEEDPLVSHFRPLEEVLMEKQQKLESISAKGDYLSSWFENPEQFSSSPEMREKLENLLENLKEVISDSGMESTSELSGEERQLLKDWINLMEKYPAKAAKQLQDTPELKDAIKQLDSIMQEAVNQWKEHSREGFDITAVQKQFYQMVKEVETEGHTPVEQQVVNPTQPAAETTSSVLALGRQVVSMEEAQDNSSETSMESTETSESGSEESDSLFQEDSDQKHKPDSQDKKSAWLKGSSSLEDMFLNKGKTFSTFSSELSRIVEKSRLVPNNNIEDAMPLEQKNRHKMAQTFTAIKSNRFGSSSKVIMNQILEQAKQIKMPKVSSIKMILKPEHLGPLKLTVSQVEKTEQIRVLFEAETVAVKEVLDKNMNQIKESLKAQGIEADAIDVELKNDQDSNAQHQEQRKRKKNINAMQFDEDGDLESTTSSEEVQTVVDHRIDRVA
jgi:hypothetical protein